MRSTSEHCFQPTQIQSLKHIIAHSQGDISMQYNGSMLRSILAE